VDIGAERRRNKLPDLLKTRLSRFAAGPSLRKQLTANRLNDMLAAIEERTPRQGNGTRLKTSPSGFTYEADPGETSSAIVLPWKLSRGPDATAKIVIGFAYYNGQSYTPKIEGEPMTADPEPMLPIEGNTVIWLRTKALFEGRSAPVALETYRNVIGNLVTIEALDFIALPTGESPKRKFASVDGGLGSISYRAIGSFSPSRGFINNAYGDAEIEVTYVPRSEVISSGGDGDGGGFDEFISWNEFAIATITPAVITVVVSSPSASRNKSPRKRHVARHRRAATRRGWLLRASGNLLDGGS